MQASVNGANDAPIEMKGIRLAGAPLYLDMQVRIFAYLHRMLTWWPVASRLQVYSLFLPLESSPNQVTATSSSSQYQTHTNPQRPATSKAARRICMPANAVPA